MQCRYRINNAGRGLYLLQNQSELAPPERSRGKNSTRIRRRASKRTKIGRVAPVAAAAAATTTTTTERGKNSSARANRTGYLKEKKA
jgi:hypothetical protein